MQFFKKFAARLSCMTNEAFLVLKWGIIISCIMLSAAIVLLIAADSGSGDTYSMLALARQLYELPAGVLLAASIASVCVEERFMK